MTTELKPQCYQCFDEAEYVTEPDAAVPNAPVCGWCLTNRWQEQPDRAKVNLHTVPMPQSSKWFSIVRSVLPILCKENGSVNAVFLCVFSHLKADGTWAMSQEEIAGEVGCSTRTVGRAVTRLRDLGIYETENPGYHKRTRFRFIDWPVQNPRVDN